jgi:hypothetical protein
MSDPMLRLTLTPARSPGSFHAHLDGAAVALANSSPVVRGAERLIELGHPPTTLLTARHAHLPYDSFVPMSLREWVALRHQPI